MSRVPSARKCGQRWLYLSFLQMREFSRGSAVRRHPKEAGGRVRREHDDTVAVPRAAARCWRRRQCLNGSRLEVETLQSPGGKESDGALVRRPEGLDPLFGAGQRLRHALIERTQPQLRRAAGHVG